MDRENDASTFVLMLNMAHAQSSEKKKKKTRNSEKLAREQNSDKTAQGGVLYSEYRANYKRQSMNTTAHGIIRQKKQTHDNKTGMKAQIRQHRARARVQAEGHVKTQGSREITFDKTHARNKKKTRGGGAETQRVFS